MPTTKKNTKTVRSPSEQDFLGNAQRSIKEVRDIAGSLETSLNMLKDDLLTLKNEVDTFKSAMANDIKRIVEHISRG